MNKHRDFLPISRADMLQRGWYYYDFLVITGDAYVDHPSFGPTIIGRILEAVETLKLLYQSLRALLKSAIPNRLVRAVFELKLMEINGEYMEKPLGRLEDSTIYTWEYVLASPVEKLYTFTVTEKVLEEFTKCVAENKRRFVDKTFHSLDILDVLVYK